MLKINKFFLYFIISILLHILFFFFIFCAKKKPAYLFTPIDVTFYSPNQNMEELSALPTIEGTSVNKAKDVSDIKESAKEDVKEQIKDLAKTKDDVVVKKKKKPIKKVKDLQENNNKDKNIKNTKKTEPVKKASSKPSVPVETAQPLKSDVLSNGNGSLYTGAFFDTNDFKYPYYANQIRRKVAAQWRWAESYGGLRVLLYFKINRDGSVGNILVKESSGNEDYDKNALYTIHRAAPFSELPEGYEGESLGVFFEIKY
ncbi:MAG: TonB C-terminal domain-containing protein [Endomicrobium sp.]|jgi:TonB family protein|nr:TonB C-terminal domain-containing protein [Endomicrobium sp.]